VAATACGVRRERELCSRELGGGGGGKRDGEKERGERLRWKVRDGGRG